MPALPEVLHYVGCDDDRGGVISVIRNLAAAGRFRCVLGVNPGCVQSRQPALPRLELPRIAGEKISPATMARARAVARAVQGWLAADATRVFHGHSRAGLLVGLWLARWGERRVVVSVHCYGRQRWFYRWAAGRLGDRLYWLSPAMKQYYGVGDETWTQCMPGCLAPGAAGPGRLARAGTEIRLGGVGALVRWKRWDLVVAALALLPAEVRQRFRFRHIGSDDGSADSRAFATELQATAGLQVEWLGQQASSAALLGATDCLVIASHNEPFSIAMLEALQAGIPVLAADSGGAKDIVQPGASGWLFRDGSADDLARRLAERAADASFPGRAIEVGIVQPFTSAVVAEKWRGIYRALVTPATP